MIAKEPVAEQRFSADDARPPATWAEARRRLAEADTYWLWLRCARTGCRISHRY